MNPLLPSHVIGLALVYRRMLDCEADRDTD